MPNKIVYESPVFDNYQTYGKNCVFRLDNSNLGIIKMMFLIFTLKSSSSVNARNYTTPTSPYLIKNVFLESFGNPIANVTTSYTLGRLDEENTDLYQQMVAGASLSGATLTDTPQTISLPLFFFAIDGQELDTRKYKNLTVRLLTKDNYSDMGFSGNIVITDVRLKCVFKDPMLYKEVAIGHSYNIQREIRDITASATTNNVETFYVNNSLIVSNLYFMIRKASNASLKGSIKSIRLTSPNREVGIYDNLTNYELRSENNANFGNTFCINFSDRYLKEYDNLITNGTLSPLKIEVTYDAASIGDYKLYTVFEYLSLLKEGPDNMLTEVFDRSIIS